MQERRLREDINKLTLSKALDYCHAVETTDYQLQIMHWKNSTETVHAVSVKPKFKPRKNYRLTCRIHRRNLTAEIVELFMALMRVPLMAKVAITVTN
jgi:hypothetical protein